MKKILLIGDSIRMGYDAYVRERMANAAKVFFPRENCMYTTHILRFLHYWTDSLKLYEADAVHFNAGLWDTLRIYGDGPLIGLEEYAENLSRITDRIRFLFPGTKVIFATSTPVIESGYIEDFEMRYNRDVEQYNETACRTLKEKGVVINDLYALLRDVPPEYHSDQSHFYTAQATERIGMQVSHVLCQALSIDEAQLILPDSRKYHCPEKGKPDRLVYRRAGHIYIDSSGQEE